MLFKCFFKCYFCGQLISWLKPRLFLLLLVHSIVLDVIESEFVCAVFFLIHFPKKDLQLQNCGAGFHGFSMKRASHLFVCSVFFLLRTTHCPWRGAVDASARLVQPRSLSQGYSLRRVGWFAVCFLSSQDAWMFWTRGEERHWSRGCFPLGLRVGCVRKKRLTKTKTKKAFPIYLWRQRTASQQERLTTVTDPCLLLLAAKITICGTCLDLV